MVPEMGGEPKPGEDDEEEVMDMEDLMAQAEQQQEESKNAPETDNIFA